MAKRRLTLTNEQARRLWLHRHGLLTPASREHCYKQFGQTLIKLGMVQLDSIGVLARAHHHILWSRHSAYRDADYDVLLGQRREAFEHFSHDAALLPIHLYPFWRRQQKRRSQTYLDGALGKQLSSKRARKRLIDELLQQIELTGPMCSRDFTSTHPRKADKTLHAWSRPPHKHALDYLWLSGDLEVSHRVGFTKYYDLSERVIPSSFSQAQIPEKQQIEFLCQSALERLGFATDSEIRRFYDASDLQEVQAWLAKCKPNNPQIDVLLHDGSSSARYADARIYKWLDELPDPNRQIRIVNPFDPVVRDRDRLSKLFGFEYRIEIYTPAAKRRFGYYVCPLLEGDRFIGRIDVRANRKIDTLETRAWWLEPGIKAGKGRRQRLFSELKRLSALVGVSTVGELPDVH